MNLKIVRWLVLELSHSQTWVSVPPVWHDDDNTASAFLHLRNTNNLIMVGSSLPSYALNALKKQEFFWPFKCNLCFHFFKMKIKLKYSPFLTYWR